jgi:predicted SAM-dependent methyltransferase
MASLRSIPAPIRETLGRLKNAVKDRRTRATLRRAARSGNVQIIVGSGGTRFDGWIPTNIGTLDLLDQSTWARFLAPGSVSAILAEHVWEHLSPEQGRIAARTCFHFLRPGGHLRAAVPDGLHPGPRYLAEVTPPADGHRVLYTFETFRAVFEEAGFRVQLYEYFDRDGTLHSDPWDPARGTILRSKQYNAAHPDLPFNPVDTSIILDATRP